MRRTACILLIVVIPSFGRGTRASSSFSEVFQVVLKASLSAWSSSSGAPSVIIFSLVRMIAKRVGLNSTDPSSYANGDYHNMLFFLNVFANTWIGMFRNRRWREANRFGHSAPKPSGGGICLRKYFQVVFSSLET